MLNQDEIAFISVAEQGGFTAAAAKLKTSKARISQQVSRLERKLGVTLLHRSTRRIRLTDEGALYLSECRRAFDIVANARKQISEDQTRVSGQIRINSVGGLFAEQLLAPAVSAFIMSYPKVDISLDFTSSRIDVLAEQYDLVVRMGQLEDSSLIARQLSFLETNVVASPEFIRRFGYPEEPNNLCDYSCLCGSIKRWVFRHAKTETTQEVNVSGPLSSPNGHVLKQAALQSLGIVRLHNLYLESDIKNKRLLPVFTSWGIDKQPVSLVYPQARYRTRRIQLFVEHIVSWFEST